MLGRAKGLVKLELSASIGTELAVVMEGCNECLHDILKKTSNLGGYNPSAVLSLTFPLACEICEALDTLHRECFVHGDLSSSTVMV